MHDLIGIIQTIVLCIQSGFVGVIIYGTINENTIPSETIQKCNKNNWICCAIILASNLLYLI